MDDKENELEPIISLISVAAEILETVSASCRNKYNELMVALQRRFGDEHKRELELRICTQMANKSLPAFAMKIERLMQPAYP